MPLFPLFGDSPQSNRWQKRGSSLPEITLLSALDSGKITGAFLDAFASEPLPQDHPFWFHPQIIVTPHIAAAGIPRDLANQVMEIMITFKQGQPLPNLVDLKQGY